MADLVPAWVEADAARALGQFIRDLRGRTGLSQAALAARARVSRNHLGVIERGGATSPRLIVLCQLAEALNVSAGTLALAFLHPPGSRAVLATPALAGPALETPSRSHTGRLGNAARLGRRVRDLRGRARMGQEHLAAAAGLSRSTIDKLERGMTSDPGLMTLVRVAHALARDAEDPIAVAATTAQLVSTFADG
jgi:transcriptional regulator with XRE-family HTH domain